MKFGVAVTTSVTPAVTATAQAEYVRRMAGAIEDAGFDSVWVSDRTLFPADLPRRYPDRFGPGQASPDAQNVLESLATLSFVGGSTRRLRLGVSVLVLPFRNPLLNAKMITTLDVLSGGRVIYGVGVGWMPEEFASMGASYRKRGALTDEHIEIFKAACARDVPEFRGKHFSTSGMVFFPAAGATAASAHLGGRKLPLRPAPVRPPGRRLARHPALPQPGRKRPPGPGSDLPHRGTGPADGWCHAAAHAGPGGRSLQRRRRTAPPDRHRGAGA